MPEEIKVKIAVETGDASANLKKASGEMKNFATATDTTNKLMKKLVGTGAAVALAYKGIKAAITFVASAISDSVMANEKMAAQIKNAQAEWGKFKSLVGDTLSAFLEQTGILDHTGEIITAIANSFNFLVTAVKVVGNSLLSFILAPLEKVLTVVGYFNNTAKDAAGIIKDMRAGFNETAREAANTYSWDSKILEKQKDNKKLIDERTKAEKKAAEELKKQTEEYEKQRLKIMQMAGERVIKFTNEISGEQDVEALQKERDRIDAEKRLQEELFEYRKQLYEEDTNEYKLAIDQKAADDSVYAQSVVALDAQIAANRKLNLQNLKNTQSKEFEFTKQAFSDLATLSKSENKKLQEVAKGAAIAEAVMNTYAGANKSLAQFGMPWAIPFMAASIAAGLANVAQIMGVGLADGGLVKATTGGVPAIIGEGGSNEAVLPLSNRSAMSEIGQAIGQFAGGNGGGATINQYYYFNEGDSSLFNTITEAVKQGMEDALEAANVLYKAGARENGVTA